MAFEVGSVVAHIKADLTDFKQGINEAKKEASSFGSNMQSIGNGIADFGKQAAVFTGIVGAGLGLVSKMGLESAAKFEQYQIAYTTLLGSQEKAAAAIKAIQDDAAKTPFELAPLVMANQRLISAGINAEDARADILNLGDAISATGGGNAELERLSTNLQQIKAVGKASALDIKQFAFAGINVYDMLAESTGKTVEQVKDMDVSYEVLADSFDKAAGKGGRFHDAMKNQSRSLNGLFSTLKDTISLGLKDILMDSGVFEAFRSTVENLIPTLTNIVPAIVRFFAVLSGGFELLGEIMSGENVMSEVKEFLSYFFGDEMLNAGEDHPAIKFMYGLANAFKFIGDWVSANKELIFSFLQGMAVGLGALLIIGTITGLIMLLLNPLSLAVFAIAALYTAWQTNFFGIRDVTMAVWGFLSDIFINYLMPLIARVTAWVQENWANIAAATTGFWNIIIGVIQMAWAVISTIIKVALALITGNYKQAWEDIKQGIDAFYTGFTRVLQGMIDFIRGWGGLLVHNLVSPFEEAWNKISDFMNKIKSALDFTQRHSPSIMDILNKSINLANKAFENLDFGGMVNPSINPTAILGQGPASNVTSVTVSLDGAYISDMSVASSLGEQIGDSILRKLNRSIRY